MNDRAQSQTIGVVLLVGIVVITVTTAGAFALSNIGSDTVTADISAHVTTDGYYFAHQGGDPVAMSELQIVIRDGNRTLRPAFSSGSVYDGDDDAVFEPGERWVGLGTSFALDTPVTVALYETRMNSLLVKETMYPNRFYAAGPTPPEPALSIDPSPAYASDPTTFDASATEAPDSSIASYTWTFEDGTTKSGETVSYTHPSTGTYNVTLSVEDERGLVSNTTRTLTVLPARPQVESVLVSNVPLNQSDVGETQTITVTYDRPMNTSTTPTAELTNLSGSVTTVSDGWVDDRTYRRTVDIGDADEESLARVNVTGGADETGSVTEPDSSTTVFVDTTVPTITDFAVTSPQNPTVKVAFNASERLDAVDVVITDNTGTAVARLTVDEFTETVEGDTVVYEATYNVSAQGKYTATLETAEDTVNNDGASGESGTVQIGSGTGEPVIRNFTAFTASADGDYVEVGNVTVENLANGEDLQSVVVEVREAGNSTVVASQSLDIGTNPDRVSKEDLRFGAPIDPDTTYNVTVVATATNDERSTASVDVASEQTQTGGEPVITTFTDVSAGNNGQSVTVGTLNATDDTNITEVSFTVYDSSGTQIGQRNVTVGSPDASLSDVTVSTAKIDQGSEYTVKVVVSDNDGNTATQSKTQTRSTNQGSGS